MLIPDSYKKPNLDGYLKDGKPDGAAEHQDGEYLHNGNPNKPITKHEGYLHNGVPTTKPVTRGS